MRTPRPALTINLGALAANYRTLQAMRPDAETAAVVKANAYGLGIDKVAPALATAGCKTFFVAYRFEGAALRQILPSQNIKICVFNGPDESDIKSYTDHQLTPVLNTLDQVRLWQKTSNSAAILHFDTAMNRLGMSAHEAATLLSDPNFCSTLNISHLMSHFAFGADASSPMNHHQAEIFAKLFDKFSMIFPDAKPSLSASAGLFLPLQIPENLTRPGLALFGGGPQDVPEACLQPVAKLTAPILQLRKINTGDTVGYNGRFTAPSPRMIATLGIGYADGFARAHGNKGQVAINQEICPIIGAISMDLTTVDATDCPTLPKIGTHAELFGDLITLEDAAARAGTISYEVLSTLGPRVERIYTA